MKNHILSLGLVAFMALSGCAMTPSKPLTFDQLGQFSSTPLNTQSYRISFMPRSNMSFATAQEVTLVKAAQTTVQNGFRYFKSEQSYATTASSRGLSSATLYAVRLLWSLSRILA